MASPKTHKAGEIIARRIYETKRRRLLKKIGITEKQLGEIFEKAVPAIKKELTALVKYSDREVERVLRKHLGGRIADKREAIVEQMIEEGASEGRLDRETFEALFGEEPGDSPLQNRSDSARGGQRTVLRLVVSEDEPQ